MELARICLSLVTDTPAVVQAELDLIAAISLLDDFGVLLLPAKLRLHKDRFLLVSQAVNSSPTAYKNSKQLFRLAHLLRISSSDKNTQRGKVLVLLSDAAFSHQDFTSSWDFCKEIIDSGYGPGWQACENVGLCDDYADTKIRLSLIAFSLVHCPADRLPHLLKCQAELQIQQLYRDVRHDEREGSREPAEKEGSHSRETSPSNSEETIENKVVSVIVSV